MNNKIDIYKIQKLIKEIKSRTKKRPYFITDVIPAFILCFNLLYCSYFFNFYFYNFIDLHLSFLSISKESYIILSFSSAVLNFSNFYRIYLEKRHIKVTNDMIKKLHIFSRCFIYKKDYQLLRDSNGELDDVINSIIASNATDVSSSRFLNMKKLKDIYFKMNHITYEEDEIEDMIEVYESKQPQKMEEVVVQIFS